MFGSLLLGGTAVAARNAERWLAESLTVNVIGYLQPLEADQKTTIARRETHRKDLINPKTSDHQGRIVRTKGDRLFAELSGTVGAVTCAVGVRRDMAVREGEVPEDRRIRDAQSTRLNSIEDEICYG